MDFQIIYTAPALTDLEEILTYSWEVYGETSETFTRLLRQHIRLLSDFPWMGARVRRFAKVRRIHHSPFDVYYRVSAERKRVEILHIRHAARRPPERLD